MLGERDRARLLYLLAGADEILEEGDAAEHEAADDSPPPPDAGGGGESSAASPRGWEAERAGGDCAPRRQ